MRYLLGLTSNNRPRYLDDAVRSWARTIAHADAMPLSTIVQHEPGPEAYACADAVSEALGVRVPRLVQTVNPTVLGPLENPWQVLDRLHDLSTEPDDILILGEDDAVVSPDAVRCVAAMADLAQKLPGYDLHRTFLCLNHRWARPLVEHAVAPAEVITTAPSFCPSIWAVTARMWFDVLRDTWDHDYSHDGWDWNFTRNVIPQHGLRILAPSLSRSDHIGRYGGAHTTEENWAGGRAPTFDPESAIYQFRYEEGPTP
jgi:hypothetical protein